MFFKCHKCSKPDDQVTLKLEGDKIICPRCGDVVRENFIEKDGVIAGIHDINFDIEPGDYVFLQRTSDDPNQNMHLIINEIFHREPYLDGKKVKKYSFSGRYTIKVYYE